MEHAAIRHYDGIVQARSAIRRAIKYSVDKKTIKELSKLEKKLDKYLKQLRG